MRRLLHPSLNVARLEQVQQALPDGALVLEFFFVEGKAVVLGIHPSGSWMQRLETTQDEIAQIIAALDFQLSKFNLGERYWQRHRRQLQRGVDEPLEALYKAHCLPP